MSWTKKFLISTLVPAGLIFALILLVDRAGRSGRISPAAVPMVPDPLGAGRNALDAGKPAEALAYFMQVPEDNPEYSRAQRFIGWKLYGDELGQPLAGLSYVNRALLREPFSGNSWQDATRAYRGAITGLWAKKPR